MLTIQVRLFFPHPTHFPVNKLCRSTAHILYEPSWRLRGEKDEGEANKQTNKQANKQVADKLLESVKNFPLSFCFFFILFLFSFRRWVYHVAMSPVFFLSLFSPLSFASLFRRLLSSNIILMLSWMERWRCVWTFRESKLEKGEVCVPFFFLFVLLSLLTKMFVKILKIDIECRLGLAVNKTVKKWRKGRTA